MATKEFIQDRLNNATAKIQKAQDLIVKKTNLLAKKKAALAKTTDEHERYWTKCDIESLEDDIQRKQREIERDLIPAKNKWEAELQKVTSVVRYIKPILDFLKMWKEKVTAYYTWQRTSDVRKNDKAKVNEAYKKYWNYYENRYQRIDSGEETWEEYEAKSREYYRAYKNLKAEYEREYSTILTWENKAESQNKTFEEVMDKELDRECDAKYDDFVNRIGDIVGDILDCSHLYVSPQGNLDGWVEGSKKDAEVRTIGAGGYRVQCFHYRILVYPRDKETHKVSR